MTEHASADRADQLLTVADVAGRIGAHERTVRGWIKNGELKGHNFGTRIGYRIRLRDYEDFLNRRATTGAISRRLLLGSLPTCSACCRSPIPCLAPCPAPPDTAPSGALWALQLARATSSGLGNG